MSDVGIKISGLYGISFGEYVGNIGPEQENYLEISDPSSQDTQNSVMPSVVIPKSTTDAIISIVSQRDFSGNTGAPHNIFDPPFDFQDINIPEFDFPKVDFDRPDSITDMLMLVQVFEGYEENEDGTLNLHKKRWKNIKREEIVELKNTIKTPVICRFFNLKTRKKSVGLDIPVYDEYFVLYPPDRTRPAPSVADNVLPLVDVKGGKYSEFPPWGAF